MIRAFRFIRWLIGSILTHLFVFALLPLWAVIEIALSIWSHFKAHEARLRRKPQPPIEEQPK